MIGRLIRAATLLGLLAVASAGPSLAEEGVTAPDHIVTAQGQVTIDSHPLHYTTRAGLLPIYDNDTGQLMARMFFIAYVADRAPNAPPRPLTFIWGGGPGANSSEGYLIGFGPRGVKTATTYPEWTAPITELEDRPDTWLAASDLVFVDPIGTGYSRATSVANRDVLYSQHGDAEAVAEMIRVYRTRYNTFDAPLYIAGESYGATRAMEVAYSLARRRTPLAGVILISGFYDVGQQTPRSLETALQVPAFADAAYFHHRLAAELQTLPRAEVLRRAEAWARTTYAPALENPASLTPDQRSAILADLARYSGMDAHALDAATLALSHDQFDDHLLSDRELGRYDARLTRPRRPEGEAWSVQRDASIAPVLDFMQGASPVLIRYLRNTLGYRSDLLYRGPFGESFHPAPLTAPPPGAGPPPEMIDDWMTLMWNHAPAPPANGLPPQPNPHPLLRAMQAEPAMRVFVVHGNYDSLGSCASQTENIARSPADIRPRVRIACYDAGHMVYTDAATRRALLGDYTQFVSGH